MFARMTPMRIIRLCLKELRESLRDRRTIVTLVLMPLLVYPLLSLILNRVLLTSAPANAEIVVSFGLGSELEKSPFSAVLSLGYSLLQDAETAPIFTEDVVYDKAIRSSATDKLTTPGLPRPHLLMLSDDGREALRNNIVDLVVTRKTPDQFGDSPSEDTDRTIEKTALEIVRQHTEVSGEVPKDFDPKTLMGIIGSYEIRYRQSDPQSERALQMLERILTAVNSEASRGLIGRDYRAPFRMVETPVAMKSNYADLLSTMIPLVLVLMTMAGAVYPAIDLTAGERERGTMEALIVSPTSNSLLLFAKYSAVVTVALLTALANLAAMSITLWVSGIGKMIFGESGLSAGAIGTVLGLLILFTMFFAALLLAVTSFAKSFKEAQAYLIPLMLLALTPGVMSLLPGIEFSGILATVPLVNIVLLARQVLVGDVDWNAALVAVTCNCIYAAAALAIASRLFGSDASMHGSQGSWRDLFLRPREWKRLPSVDQMALTMAAMFPLYFIASSTLPSVSEQFSTRLWISAGVSFLLILGVPLFVNWFRRIEFVATYRLRAGTVLGWIAWLPAILLVAGSAWMAAHEIFIGAQLLGIGTINDDTFARVAEFGKQLQSSPLWMILFVFALTPAVCEEFMFRGFVLSSLNKYSAAWAICLSSILFGLMHVLTSNVLAVERFLPSTFMGLILATVAIRTGSIWPGILLHAMHNGLLLTVSHFEEKLKSWKILIDDGKHLPAEWLVSGGIALAIGLLLFWWSTRKAPTRASPST